MQHSTYNAQAVIDNDTSIQKYKVVFVGDSTTGKTSLIRSYVDKKIDETLPSTIGATSTRIRMTVNSIENECTSEGSDERSEEETKSSSSSLTKTQKCSEAKVDLNVWDTAGQETLRNIVPMYARGADAAIIVFDQSKGETLDHIIDWFNLIKMQVGNDVSMFVAQNKVDLPSEVDTYNLYLWAEENKVSIFQTSAKTGEGVSALFNFVAKSLYQNENDQHLVNPEPLKNTTIELLPKEKTKKKIRCC